MLSVLIIAIIGTVPIVFASAETMICIDPSEASFVGKAFSVSINIVDVSNLYGYDIWLRYNTTLLEVLSVGSPHFLPEPMIEIIEPEGIVHIYKILLPPAPPVFGSGTVAFVIFNATAVGSCILDFLTPNCLTLT